MHKQAWCFTDGAAGCINQVTGLAQAMGLTPVLKKVSLHSPWHYLPSGFYPWPSRALSCLQQMPLSDCPPVVITCGKRSIFAALYLKKNLGSAITTIHIQDPKISSHYFDFVVAPKHDKITGKNVIKTRFAITHITPTLLENAAQQHAALFSSIHRPIMAVILGGTNRHFHFREKDLLALNQRIKQITAEHRLQTIILFSRRTPTCIQKFFHDTFFGHPHINVWNNTSINPYLTLLAIAKYIVLTCDSASMISESITAEKATYVYQLPAKKRYSRLQKFLDILHAENLVAAFNSPLPTCLPIPTSETTQVAKYLLSKL